MSDISKVIRADFGEIAQTVERVLAREEEGCAVQERELAVLRKKLRRRQSKLRAKRRGLERFAEEWRRAEEYTESVRLDDQGEQNGEPETVGDLEEVAVGAGR